MTYAHDSRDDAEGLGPEPASVHELLAIRAGGLGDVVRAVPALRHLRATFVDARISVVASQAGRALLDTCPYVDRTIALERPSEALLERFDVALSFAHPGEQSRLSLKVIDAGMRVGWRLGRESGRRAIRPLWPERLDDRSRMLRLAWLLGGALHADPGLGLWPSLADRNGAARLVADTQRPLAIIHVGSGSSQRRWPAARWARVLDLIDGIGLEPVLVGTSEDQSIVDQVVASVRHAPMSLLGKTNVGELVGLLE
ncbi:MAG: glycosyltransferase family 9 protein, partial [Gaiellales bacterium]